MHGKKAEGAFHEPAVSGTGVSPVSFGSAVQIETHGRDARATTSPHSFHGPNARPNDVEGFP